MNPSPKDRLYLREALTQAEIRKGFCSPNPSVGCVIVKDGTVLARGSHFAAGHAHAEVEALKNCGNEAQGATLYVTLEPCCSWGRTPPCTDLIIEKKLGRVVYGHEDPDPRMRGSGAAKLRDAGIGCELFRSSDVEEFYKSYDYWHKTKRPFVTAKLALSLDGKSAGPGKDRVHITGPEADAFTHEKRLHSDAILSTAATVCCDNPKLNARVSGQSTPKPVYLIDRTLSLSPNFQVFDSAQSVTLFCDDSLQRTGEHSKTVRYVSVKSHNGHLSWEEMLRRIAEDGIHDLWIEAGGNCVESLAQSGFLNRFYCYIAPLCLGDEAHSAFLKPLNGLFSTAKISWSSLGRDGICEMNW